MTTTATARRSSRSKDRRAAKNRVAAKDHGAPSDESPASAARRRTTEPASRKPTEPQLAPERFVLATGTAADHAALQHMLGSVFPVAMRDAFVVSLDDPFYEPADRLVVRRGDQLVAHAHLVERVMQFGSAELPISVLAGLATLPEYRSRGLARGLTMAAERMMRRGGAVLGLLSTRLPKFFRAHGWALCGRYSHSRANTRELLAQLSSRGVAPGEGSVAIRPWRQVELPGLMRLYAERTAGAFGPFQRTEAYWRWLISRQEFDQIFVALDGTDHVDWASIESPIAGYLVMREDRILELTARPSVARSNTLLDAPAASVIDQLLARACAEAIERDYHSVQLHAAPDEPLHQLFLNSAGAITHDEAHQGEVLMVRLLDPSGFVKRIADELQRRAVAAALPRKVEVGFLINGQKHRLVVSRRQVRFERGNLGRSYLRLNEQEFTRLLMGHLDLSAAVAQGRVEASTRLALETAAALFPRLPYWRAPWDDVVC